MTNPPAAAAASDPIEAASDTPAAAASDPIEAASDHPAAAASASDPIEAASDPIEAPVLEVGANANPVGAIEAAEEELLQVIVEELLQVILEDAGANSNPVGAIEAAEEELLQVIVEDAGTNSNPVEAIEAAEEELLQVIFEDAGAANPVGAIEAAEEELLQVIVEDAGANANPVGAIEAAEEPVLQVLVPNANPVGANLNVLVHGKLDVTFDGRDVSVKMNGKKNYDLFVKIQAGETHTTLTITLLDESFFYGGTLERGFNLIFAFRPANIISANRISERVSDRSGELAGMVFNVEGDIGSNLGIMTEHGNVFVLLNENGAYEFKLKVAPPASVEPLSTLNTILTHSAGLTLTISHGFIQDGNLVGAIIKGVIEYGVHHAIIHTAIVGIKQFRSLRRRVFQSASSTSVEVVSGESVQNDGAADIESGAGERSLTSNPDGEGRVSGSANVGGEAPPRYFCPFHSYTADDFEELVHHYLVGHPFEDVFSCQECESLFFSLEESYAHESETTHQTKSIRT